MHKFIPVRVTSKQRAESFLSGEIYMSPLYRFGSWGRRDGASDVQNSFRGDMTEGAVQVFSDPIEGGLNMLSSIPDSIKPLVDKITWVDLGDLQYYKVLCFYSLLYDASNDWFIAPDPRLAEFGDTALVIIDMDEFMRRMLRALLDKYGEHSIFLADTVNYFNHSVTRKLQPLFEKDESYSWQNEYRIAFSRLADPNDPYVIENHLEGKMLLDLDPVILQIGNISDIVAVYSADKLIDLSFIDRNTRLRFPMSDDPDNNPAMIDMIAADTKENLKNFKQGWIKPIVEFKKI